LVSVGPVRLHIVGFPFLDGDPVAEEEKVPLSEQAFELSTIWVLKGD